MRYSSFLLFSCFMVFAVSCDKEDDGPTAPGTPGGSGNIGNGTFVATIDGQAFTSNPLLVAGASNMSGFQVRSATGSTIINGDTTSLVITITFFDPAAFAVGQQFRGLNGALGNFAFGFYGRRNASGQIEAYSEDLAMNNAVVTITDIDLSDERWSATFSYDAIDNNTNSNYSVTGGVFSGVKYN